MQQKRLGKTDLQFTRIGLGTWAIGGGDWRFGWGPQDERDAVGAITRAVDLGINWIDTAPVYGNGRAEELVGQGLKELGPDKPLVANLDPVNAVMKSTPEAIQDALRAVYNTVGNPLMAGAGCEIPAGTKPELLQALCEPIPYQA